jgi:hypothetical protein
MWVLLAAYCVAGLSLSFQQAFTAAGGTVRTEYTSLISAPSAQAAADTVVKAKAAGLDGVLVATNDNQFVAGEQRTAYYV